MSDLDALLSPFLDRRCLENRFRLRRLLRPLDAVHIEWKGQRHVNFASNNYLGLTHHPAVVEAVARAAREYGAGTGAAALVSGYTPAHEQAEAAVARWKGTEAAVLFSSGYQANQAAVAMLGALPQPPRFLIDKLAHASLVEAVRSSGRPFRVFPHNHLTKLRRLLEESPADQPQIVVTESIFSMDGDAADLVGLAELKRAYPFILLLDEAHAGGVYGDDGAGYACEVGLSGLAEISVVTFSKALGVMGGAVCGSVVVRDALFNSAPSAIYSTHLSSSVAAAVTAAIEVIRSEPQRRVRVRKLAEQLRNALRENNISIPPGDSPIVPVILGSESAAMDAAQRLLHKGLWVPAIRPPTVPPAASRLRVTLSCEHSDEELQRLIEALLSTR